MKPVLLISTTFFPHPVVGAIRTTRFATHLPEFGYKPIVLTRWYGHEATRALLDERVHPEAEVIYLDRPEAAPAPATPAPSTPPAGHAGAAPPSRSTTTFGPIRRLRSRLGRIASTMVVPDATALLWPRFAGAIERIIADRQPVAMCTTSPPFATHLVGLRLRPRLGLPWIAGYEDPYLIDPRFGARGIRNRAHHRFDREVHRVSDILLHTIPMQARWSALAYPEFRHKGRLITMGTPMELAEGRVEPDRAPPGVVSVRIVGFIADEPALDLARAVESLRASGVDAELRLVGKPPANLEAIRAILGDRVIATGFLRHDQALRQVMGASILVNYLNPERASVLGLSSKYFEYLATGAPVLAINPTASDRHFLRKHPFVTVLDHPSAEALSAALRAAATDPAKRPPPTFARQFAAQHNWREKTRALADILDRLSDSSQR